MKTVLSILALLIFANSQNYNPPQSLSDLYFPSLTPQPKQNQAVQFPTSLPNSNTNSNLPAASSGTSPLSINSATTQSQTASSTQIPVNNQRTTSGGNSAAQIQTIQASNLRTASISQNPSAQSSSPSTSSNDTNQRQSNSNLFAGNTNQFFSQLPSFATVEALIQKADQVAMVKLIQQVATNAELTCDQKISYLLEVIGIVRTIIQDKYGEANQIQVIIDAANAQIDRLNKQIQRVQQQMEQIQIETFNKAIKTDINLLTKYYEIYNNQQEKLNVLNPKIREQRQGISNLKNEIQKERENILLKEQTISELDIRISLLQQQLGDVRQKRAEQSASLMKSNRTVQINTVIIARNERSVEVLQNQAAEIQKKIAEFNDKISDLEVQVERKRSDNTVATEKYLSLVKDVRDLEDRIVEEKKKMRTDNLKFLVEMIKTLKEQEVVFQSQIDDYYYKCYADSQIKPEKSPNQDVVFVGNNIAIQKYIEKSYEEKVVIDTKNATVKFFKIDLFGTKWQRRYATPFPYIDNTLEVKEFSCMEGADSAEKGKGLIRAIYKDYIQIVNQDNRSLRFKLGSCTRLESTTELPAAGQTLYWSGKPGRGYDEYNLFFGTII